MYRRENGRVVIDISEDEFAELLLAMGFAIGGASGFQGFRQAWLRLVNSINEGNPNFTPYEVQ